MKQQVVCEVCQGELLKQENKFICQHCGIKYSVEEVKRMLTEKQLKEGDGLSEKQNLKDEAERLREEEKQRLMEEQRLKEEEQKIIAEEKRLKEEEQKLKEEKERLKEVLRLKEVQQKIIAEEQRLVEEKERLKEEQRLKEEERQREEQRLKEEQQKIIAEEQKLKEEKERLTGKLRVIAKAPQEAPKEEVAKEAPQQAPKEIVKEISKENEKSIFDEPAKQKKKKGCFLYLIIIIFLLAIIAYFAQPYYIDYIGAKVEKENDNAVVEADTLQQNPEQNLGVSDSIKNPSDTIVAKEVQDEAKITKKTEASKKDEAPKKRTEAEKQTDDDVAKAIAAVLKSESKQEPEPAAPKPNSEPKSKAKDETSHKGNFYKTSFNCEKTNHATALVICTNEELARLDVQLNKLYQPIKIAYEEEQTEWRKTLSKCKVDVNCLDKMYRDRIKVLKDAQ